MDSFPEPIFSHSFKTIVLGIIVPHPMKIVLKENGYDIVEDQVITV